MPTVKLPLVQLPRLDDLFDHLSPLAPPLTPTLHHRSITSSPSQHRSFTHLYIICSPPHMMCEGSGFRQPLHRFSPRSLRQKVTESGSLVSLQAAPFQPCLPDRALLVMPCLVPIAAVGCEMCHQTPIEAHAWMMTVAPVLKLDQARHCAVVRQLSVQI